MSSRERHHPCVGFSGGVGPYSPWRVKARTEHVLHGVHFRLPEWQQISNLCMAGFTEECRRAGRRKQISRIWGAVFPEHI